MSSRTSDHTPSRTATDTTEPDTFEPFNRAQGAGSVRNPDPRFAELRREAGVVEIDVRDLTVPLPVQVIAGIA